MMLDRRGSLALEWSDGAGLGFRVEGFEFLRGLYRVEGFFGFRNQTSELGRGYRLSGLPQTPIHS